MRVGPSSPTAPRSCPSMETGATTTAHDESGSKPCSVPMATESPLSRTSRRQGDDHQLLFEDGQDGTHRLHGVERLGQAGRTADEHLVGVHGALEGVEGHVRRDDELVDLGGSARRDGPGLGEGASDQVGGEQGAGPGERRPRRSRPAARWSASPRRRRTAPRPTAHATARGRRAGPTGWWRCRARDRRRRRRRRSARRAGPRRCSSTVSISPWTCSKNCETCLRWIGPRTPGPVRWSTKKR